MQDWPRQYPRDGVQGAAAHALQDPHAMLVQSFPQGVCAHAARAGVFGAQARPQSVQHPGCGVRLAGQVQQLLVQLPDPLLRIAVIVRSHGPAACLFPALALDCEIHGQLGACTENRRRSITSAILGSR